MPIHASETSVFATPPAACPATRRSPVRRRRGVHSIRVARSRGKNVQPRTWRCDLPAIAAGRPACSPRRWAHDRASTAGPRARGHLPRSRQPVRARRRRRRPEPRARRDRGPGRGERVRQDDAVAHSAGAGETLRRRGAGVRPSAGVLGCGVEEAPAQRTTGPAGPDGALNPRRSVYEAVAEGLRVHKFDGDERGAVADALSRAGLRPRNGSSCATRTSCPAASGSAW